MKMSSNGAKVQSNVFFFHQSQVETSLAEDDAALAFAELRFRTRSPFAISWSPPRQPGRVMR